MISEKNYNKALTTWGRLWADYLDIEAEYEQAARDARDGYGWHPGELLDELDELNPLIVRAWQVVQAERQTYQDAIQEARDLMARGIHPSAFDNPRAWAFEDESGNVFDNDYVPF